MPTKYLYIILIIISLSVTYFSVISINDLQNKRLRLVEAKNTLEELKKKNKDLKAELNYRKTDEFVIKEAREKLNYSFSDEEIYIVPKDYAVTANDVEHESAAMTMKSEFKNEENSVDLSKPAILLWYEVFF